MTQDYILNKRAVLEVQQDLSELGCLYAFVEGAQVKVSPGFLLSRRQHKTAMKPYDGVCVCTNFYILPFILGKDNHKKYFFCVLIEAGVKRVELIGPKKMISEKRWDYSKLSHLLNLPQAIREPANIWEFSYAVAE